MAMIDNPRPPTFSEKVQVSVAKNAPGVVGRSLQLLMRGFVTLFRFVQSLIAEALGRQ